MQYTIYKSEEAAQTSGETDVLVARPCSECGDELLGLPGHIGPVACEDGHHGTRPGLHYVNGQTINISEEED